MNAYEEAYEIAKLQAIIKNCSTVPGYWFTVYFIDPVGRVKIQMMGFLLMAIVYLAIGIPYSMKWKGSTNVGFMILYGLTFLFSNFGPNTTTFIVPVELFSARFRSTCHGISGAVGLLGRWGQFWLGWVFVGFAL
jgi:PHS family inorganic phosphate transporter-like MFS transporter